MRPCCRVVPALFVGNYCFESKGLRCKTTSRRQGDNKRLKYGVKYLQGAWLVAGGDREDAVGWYARGYYYEAQRKGLLEETGLR